MSDFMKSLLKIAIPVTLQSMLQSSFSVVDQLMIGQLGEVNISAVGLVGNFNLIYSVVIGAVGGVAGILIAQFLGAKDNEEAWRGFSVSGLIGILISALFLVSSFFFGGSILGLYTKDAAIVTAGIPYIRLIAFTFIPMGISTIISTWLRCKEHAVFPMIASFGAVIVNTGLNYILIFGKLGFAPMGVRGAGLATLVSQLFNFVLIFAGFLYSNHMDGDKVTLSLHLTKISAKDYIFMIAPILFSEFLWSLGQNVESAVYGHLSTASLAAYTLTCPIQGLMVGALSGLSAAAGVMVGKHLGGGDYDSAYKDAKRIMYAGFGGTVLLAIFLIGFSGYYVTFYQVDPSVMNIGRTLLIVFALYSPVKVQNMILGGGIIKSGGDTRTIMWIDTIGTWAVGVPLCFFAAYVLHFQIVGVYALLTLDEVFRLAVTLIVFRRKKWMRSIA